MRPIGQFIWRRHKDSMSQDFQRDCNLDEAIRKAYLQINTFLSHERSDITNFPTMPQLTDIDITIDDRNNDDMVYYCNNIKKLVKYNIKN